MMTVRALLRGLCVSVVLGATAAPGGAQTSPPESSQAKKTVALVDKAAALVKERGKAAFAEFRKPGSEWFAGETYLFAYDLKANVLLNPAFPKREGTNVAGQKDVNGKPCHDEIIRTVETKDSGWVECTLLPKPGQTQPARKWIYAKRVDIDRVPGLIASGFYPE